MLWLLLLTGAQASLADDALDALKAPAAALRNERVLMVPGDPDRPVMLQMTLYTPDGPGPFPLAVMNHGSAGNMPADLQPRNHLTFAAYYFLSRGYAVALPMMRGYAGSGGHLGSHGCDDMATGLDAAQDIRAVIGYLKQQPDIDGSRIVVAGQSFGGWNTLATGTLNVPGVKGLMSFAGGMKASSCRDPDTELIRAAGELGARTRTPSIWFFGDNDATFATWVWHGMYERYMMAGGPVELVAYGPFGSDSHNMLGSASGLPLWVPRADAFLARVGLPHTLLYPEYLPTPAPPPSHYADINDAQALPYLGEQGAAYYRKFLSRSLPRALAIGPHGAGTASEGFDAIAQALKLCGQQGPGCRLYAVDNNVVWVRPTPAPPPTHFAAISDEAAVPYLNAGGRAGYEKFLTMRRPRAFAVAPDGGWDAASAGADPVAFALAHCAQLHRGCQLYAVDGDVVWSQTPASGTGRSARSTTPSTLRGTPSPVGKQHAVTGANGA
ncbi:prolyl oligopeptidase family serine peptidase [Paraburkholderia aspalathi]|uniref:dienelactone hydrolase family protein n=1 Tax=Paraburkholderia nemoris TaxID=2793076 RepID=UPI00190AF051|nr:MULTISPECIES: CocE/NonD family hydrolase [Paraburkholderia]MBK3786997.1 prolyl oligopeptidase family serine peptidase [Paraburkholderia aspalathi]